MLKKGTCVVPVRDLLEKNLATRAPQLYSVKLYNSIPGASYHTIRISSNLYCVVTF